MAIKTMAAATGGKWTEGWHTLEISEAFYGTWSEKRYLEMKFKDYPDNFSLRVYEAHNKETHEEFAVARLFRLANAGIVDEIESPDGKKALQYDDEPSNFVGKFIQGFFYKNKDGYKRVSDRIAPVVQEGDVLSYNEEQVTYWKDAAEKHWLERLKADAPANPTTEEEEIPF